MPAQHRRQTALRPSVMALAVALLTASTTGQAVTVWTGGSLHSGVYNDLVSMTYPGPFAVNGTTRFNAGAEWTNTGGSFGGRMQVQGGTLANSVGSTFTANGKGTVVYGLTSSGSSSFWNEGKLMFNGTGNSANLNELAIDTDYFINTAGATLTVNSGSARVGRYATWQSSPSITNQQNGAIQINGGELMLAGSLSFGANASIYDAGRLTLAGNGTVNLPTVTGGGELKLISGRPPLSANSSYGSMVLNTGAQSFSRLVVAGNGATLNLGGALTLGALELPQNYFTDQGLYDAKAAVVFNGETSQVGTLQIDAGKLVLTAAHSMVVTGNLSTNPATAGYAGGIQVDAGSTLQFTGGSAASRQRLSGAKVNVDGQATLDGWLELNNIQLSGTGKAAITGNVLFTGGNNVLGGTTTFSTSGATLGVASGSLLSADVSQLTGIAGFDNQGLVQLQGTGQIGGNFANGGTVRVLGGVTSFSNLLNLQFGGLSSGTWELAGGNLDLGAGVTNNTTIRALPGGGVLSLATNGLNGLIDSSGYLHLNTAGFNNLGTVRAQGGQVVVNGAGSLNNGLFEARGVYVNDNTYIWAPGLLIDASEGRLDGATFRAMNGSTIMVPNAMMVNNARIELTDGGLFMNEGYANLAELLTENRGTITITNQGGSSFGDSSFVRGYAGDFLNSGTLALTRATLDMSVAGANLINTGTLNVTEGSMSVFDVLNSGHVSVTNSALSVGGNFTNNGSVLLVDSNLSVPGTLTLNGGTFTVQGSLGNPNRPQASINLLNLASGVLHLDNADATVKTGLLNVDVANGSATLVAGGNLRLRNDATLTLTELHTSAGPAPLLQTNAGNIELHDTARILGADGNNALENLQRNEVGARLSLQDGATLTLNLPFVNAGTLHIGAGSALQAGDLTQTEGLLTVDGTLDNYGGITRLQGGVLNGNGVINGDLFIGGGPTTASFRPGHSPGHFDVTGNLVVGQGGELELEVARAADGSLLWDSVTAASMSFEYGSSVHLVLGTGVAGNAALTGIHFLDCTYGCSASQVNWVVDGADGYTVAFDGNGISLVAPPVPEPGTWALWLLGAAALGARLRSRRQGAAQ